MSCRCTGFNIHCYDQGGYETCSCNTCTNPECVYVRSSYRREELEREERDYRSYLQLKERFGNR